MQKKGIGRIYSGYPRLYDGTFSKIVRPVVRFGLEKNNTTFTDDGFYYAVPLSVVSQNLPIEEISRKHRFNPCFAIHAASKR